MSGIAKSYRLVEPRIFTTHEEAREVILSHPRNVYQIEELETTPFEPESLFRLWHVVFVGLYCPVCGLADGTTDIGASDPRKSGGAEHICWRCAEMYDKTKKWWIDTHSSKIVLPIYHIWERFGFTDDIWQWDGVEK